MVIAGTGHRPPKLGGYGVGARVVLANIAVERMKKNKPEKVISGGALGWDQAIAEAAWQLNIPYVMALPFRGFDSKWPVQSRSILSELNKHAECVHYVCEDGYAPWKMQTRNEWMVDNCDQVLAMWDGSTGGTGNCIAYANKINKPIVNLYDEWSKYVQDNRGV